MGQGKISDGWHDDGKSNFDDKPYLPENPGKILSLIFSASYSPLTWADFNVYYRPWWKNGDFRQGVHVFMRLGVPGKINYNLGNEG